MFVSYAEICIKYQLLCGSVASVFVKQEFFEGRKMKVAKT
jgi:hypothetical protein